MRICTQKAQQDLRYEEDIDAFSMSDELAGRLSPLPNPDGMTGIFRIF